MAPELVGSGNEGASVAQNAGTEGTLATAEPTKSGRVTKAQKAEKDLLEFLNKLKSSGKGNSLDTTCSVYKETMLPYLAWSTLRLDQ